MDLTITQQNRIICEECWNADSGNSFIMSDKIDDRLSKDNMKLYKVKWVSDGRTEFNYPNMSIKVGDIVMTEALGIDITFEGKQYKVFDTNHIVSKVIL